jgi:hypothetical protein
MMVLTAEEARYHRERENYVMKTEVLGALSREGELVYFDIIVWQLWRLSGLTC